MSSKAITMRKIKEVLRLRFECHLSFNAIARALELSKGAVAKYAALAQAAQLDWQSIEPLDEAQLAKRLLPRQAMVPGQSQFAPIDFVLVNGRHSITADIGLRLSRFFCSILGSLH